MGDWITRIVASLCLFGTGFFVGSIFVAKQYGESIGFPYTTADRLQWEVLATGIAAIIGGALAYFGATNPHASAKKQSFVAFRAKVIKATEVICIFQETRSETNASFVAMLRTEKGDDFNEFRTNILSHFIAALPEALSAPPQEIITVELDVLISEVCAYCYMIMHTNDETIVGHERLIVSIDNLRTYLDKKCS